MFDISTPQGQVLIAQLVAEVDVLVENYKVGQLTKYGPDYENLKAIKPDLVYRSIMDLDQTGPCAPRPGYDFIVQGMGGFMNVTGRRDDLPEGGPQKASVAIADLFTGAHVTIAILAALAHRDRTDEGQHLDICLLDTQVAMMASMVTNYLITDASPQRQDDAHPNIVPYQMFEVADGWVIVTCGNDGQFRKLMEAEGEPALADDERSAISPQRVRNRQVLVPLLEPMIPKKTRAQRTATLESVSVPYGPISDLTDAFEDPHMLAHEMRFNLPHPVTGRINVPTSTFKMSGSPVEY